MENQTCATVAIAQTNEKHRSRERVLGVVREAIEEYESAINPKRGSRACG